MRIIYFWLLAFFFLISVFMVPKDVLAAVNPRADINQDGIINIADFRILITNLGRLSSQGFIPSTSEPDITQNGKVDIFDWNVLFANFGRTLASPTPTPISSPSQPPTGNIKVLCEGKSFSHWGNSTPIEIGNSPDDTNPNILKVVRNCNFVNPLGVPSYRPAIVIKQGNNILIEGSRFDNIRTLIPDDGVFGIGIPGTGQVENVIIRNSYFNDIGADGIQAGYSGNKIGNIRIENNEFVGSEEVGENAIDIKTGGPYIITGNIIHGFRPCESSKTNPSGNQDCSGSTGPGIVVHIGSVGIPPHDVTIGGNDIHDSNDIYDNTHGLNISGGNNIVIQGNIIHDNLKTGINYSGGDVTLLGNTYYRNGRNCSGITPCQ